jgi:hypothetical protein
MNADCRIYGFEEARNQVDLEIVLPKTVHDTQELAVRLPRESDDDSVDLLTANDLRNLVRGPDDL